MIPNNEQFLQTIFGDQYARVHVTAFTDDPSNIATERQMPCWRGGMFSCYQFPVDPSNQYFTISLFNLDDNGYPRRKKDLFVATYCIVLDDVEEKLPLAEVQKLPPPTWILETSPGSEQWGYILDVPCYLRHWVENLLDGLVANGLAPGGKDPGMKGVTRYVRLPDGVNNKAGKLLNGNPWRCRMKLWKPERNVSMQALAEPFDVDLDAGRAESSSTGTAAIPDHPLLTCGMLTVNRVISPGTIDIQCPWLDEHTAGDNSGSAVFTKDDGTIGFKCHHGSCEGRTANDLLDYLEQRQPGFMTSLGIWQLGRTMGTPALPPPPVAGAIPLPPGSAPPPPPVLTDPLDILDSMTVSTTSRQLRADMAAQKFLMKDLILMEQWSVIYAAPGSGKTLLTLKMICESLDRGDIDGNRVYYINCDDTHRGMVIKKELAETYGFKMAVPGQDNFSVNQIIPLLQQMVLAGCALGVVMILDTLKKFTDLMDKKTSSEFGVVARSFVAAGGTLLCLAHVNKNKDSNDKRVHAGTTDIVDDADCAYIIEQLGEAPSHDDEGVSHTVQFENQKSRGDVADTAMFRFTKTEGAGYLHLFDSVSRMDERAVKVFEHEVELADQAAVEAEDASVIAHVADAINAGRMKTREIENYIQSTNNVSQRITRKIMQRYDGVKWRNCRGDRNALVWELIEDVPAEEPVSFL